MYACVCVQGVPPMCVCVCACRWDCVLVLLAIILGVRWVRGSVAFQVRYERRISASANGSPCTRTRRCPPIRTYWGSQKPDRTETDEKKRIIPGILANKQRLAYKVKVLFVVAANLFWTWHRKYWEEHIVWGHFKCRCSVSHDCAAQICCLRPQA